jgi:probable lipoprotein (TIGR04455 family)
MRRLEPLLLLLTACSTVDHSSVRSDYDEADKQQTVRLVAIAAPAPNGDEALGMLAAKITQRYANHHRDFVVKAARTGDALPEDRCEAPMQGVLEVAMTLDGGGDEVGVTADVKLVRCRDGEQVWSAGGSGSWPTTDPQISQVIAQYREELGDEVAPFVPAVFHLLRALLDTLPYPELVDDDLIMEKIELAD